MTTSYTIPGVAEPIPAEAVLELIADNEVSGSISDLAQTNWYRFAMPANVPARVTFTASPAEYSIQPYLRYIDKGSANAHSPQPESVQETLIYNFLLDESNEVFLAIARLGGAISNGGFTLRLTVGPIDKGSANAH